MVNCFEQFKKYTTKKEMLQNQCRPHTADSYFLKNYPSEHASKYYISPRRSYTVLIDKRESQKKRHLLHVSGRMQAGKNVVNGSSAAQVDKCECCEGSWFPKVTVCEGCGGYSYTGRTCDNSGDAPRKAIRTKNSPFPYCSCCQSETRKEIKKNTAKQIRANENPLMNGPFADKLIKLFLPGNKNNAPAIVGYREDGSPIYGPPGGASNIIGYNDKGEPIYIPGTSGPNDKGLIMGYRPDGTPIHPPPNVAPKDAMAIIGKYAKYNSPIIGNRNFSRGLMMKGKNPDGSPNYVPVPDDYQVPSKLEPEKVIEKKQKKVEPKAQVEKDIKNFYPRCKYHPNCVPENKPVPPKMAWNWKQSDDPCDLSQLPFWYPPKYKPGAVAERVAKIIKKHRILPMKCPYNLDSTYLSASSVHAAHLAQSYLKSYLKCPCPKNNCPCTDCSLKKAEKKAKMKLLSKVKI